MNADARLDATPSGILLCTLETIEDGRARNFVVQLRAGRFHGFVVRQGMEVFGYVDRCPHMGVPLAQVLDEYLAPSGDHIVCAWHGAVFDIMSGACLGGPCVGERLQVWPVRVVGGHVVTGKEGLLF